MMPAALDELCPLCMFKKICIVRAGITTLNRPLKPITYCDLYIWEGELDEQADNGDTRPVTE
jgi:hypothetical protein